MEQPQRTGGASTQFGQGGQQHQGARGSQGGQQFRGGRQQQGRNQQLSTEIAQAVEVCSWCADQCILSQDPQMTECIRRCEDVAEIGEAALAIAPRNSPYTTSLIGVLQQAVDACARECSRHQANHCQECASTLSQTLQTLQQYTGGMSQTGGGTAQAGSGMQQLGGGTGQQGTTGQYGQGTTTAQTSF